MSVLEQLGDPRDFWEEFLFVSSVPRGSGNCGHIREALVKRAREAGLEAIVEEPSGNVLVRKPADPGWEGVPSICLQAHMDMVCVKDPGVEHDFDKDPIDVVVEGDVVTARGTTLGADDGIGVAAAMAIIKNKEFKSGPIEALFTVDEETTMAGINALTKDLLKSRLFVNIDSEEMGIVTIGSAGGFGTIFHPELKTEKKTGKTLTVRFSGLAGGHSGVEIHKNRANCLVLMAQMLDVAMDYGAQLVNIDAGAAPMNVICKEGWFTITAPCCCEVSEKLKILAAQMKQVYKTTDPDMKIEFVCGGEEPKEVEAVVAPEGRRFVDFLQALPFGVIRSSAEVSDLVESSTNIAYVHKDEKGPEGVLALSLACLTRSSQNSVKAALIRKFDSLARLAGFRIENSIAPYSGWAPNPDSPLLKRWLGVAKTVTGEDWKVLAIHAGLECGEVFEKYPDMDAISVGPDIFNVHSTQEICRIATVPPFVEIIKGVIQSLRE